MKDILHIDLIYSYMNNKTIVLIYGTCPVNISNELRQTIRDEDLKLLNKISKKPSKTRRESIAIIKSILKKNNWKYKKTERPGLQETKFDIYI